MSTILPDDRPTEKQRALADQKREGRKKKPSILADGQTPLMLSLEEHQQAWLLEYASNQWQDLHGKLVDWRAKLDKYEQYADGDYGARVRPPDPDKTDATRSMFEHQNYTLGLADGFCDFVYSQAKDDIFSVKPWIAATPQGKNDIALAENVTRHIQWRFGQSNLEEVFVDAIKLAVDLGTAFVRLRWDTVGEEYEEIRVVAYSKTSGEDITDSAGNTFSSADEIPDELRGPDIGWREELVPSPMEIYRNVHGECLDFRNIAFDPQAAELDLRKTDFFTRFTLGLHDLVAHYGLTEEQRDQLVSQLNWEPEEEERDHREEEGMSGVRFRDADSESNPPITLIEGFIRCDPKGKGQPIRIHIVFSPTLRVLFTADYLANITPGGMLPVFPVRCYKRPRRIIGVGYREAAEDQNDAVDEQHNATVVRNRQSAEIFKGIKSSALQSKGEGEDMVNTPTKLWEISEEAEDINDVFSFLRLPDANDRTIEIMNQHLQMAQMRFGISSAAQGELKGIPQSNTATGVNSIMSRGATLVKAQIEQIKSDLVKPAEYGVHLTYANQDVDETFTWGEGEATELIEIRAGDVKGLRMNVKLTLTQAQNIEKLESSQVGLQLAMQFAQLPPQSQMQFRRLLVQALKQLGFNDADDMVQPGPVDPMQLVEMADPAIQPYLMQALEMAMQEGAIAGGPEPVQDAPQA